MKDEIIDDYTCIVDGQAYIIAKSGATVCCGKEEDVIPYLNNEKPMPEYLTFHERMAILSTKELIDGDREDNLERECNSGIIGDKQKTTGLPQKGQRLSLRQDKQKNKNLLRRGSSRMAKRG